MRAYVYEIYRDGELETWTSTLIGAKFAIWWRTRVRPSAKVGSVVYEKVV
jgi:hypothetical protein